MLLPASLDTGAAKPLWAALAGERGKPLDLDANEVERLGAPCLQVLLAAKAQCEADGVGFTLANPSEALLAALNIMGFNHDLTARAA